MRLTTKFIAAATALTLAGVAFAADPIVGNWKMSEKGEVKAIVTISPDNDGFKGVLTQGLTEKAKSREGNQVLFDIKSNGDGKYKGKGKHPVLGIKGTVKITVDGNNITIKSITGTQTGVKQ